MNFQIKIIAVENETIPNKNGKGTYNKLTVTYKDVATGKVNGKPIFSFGNGKPAFDSLQSATPNAIYVVEAIKNESSGYWDWVAAAPSTGQAYTSAMAASHTPAPSRGSAENVERQTMIVRQNALGHAVAMFGINKEKADPYAVIEVAKVFEKYVLTFNAEDDAEVSADSVQ